MTPLPKTSSPAARALEAAGIDSLEALAEHRRKDILALHGMGPKALRILEETMANASLRFRD